MVLTLEEKVKPTLKGLFASVVCGEEKDEEEVNEMSDVGKANRRVDHVRTTNSCQYSCTWM